jgi:hypothetical protein
LAIEDIDGSNEDAVEGNSLLKLVTCGVENAKISIFAARIDLTFGVPYSAYKATLVEIEGLRAVVTVPDINQAVGTACIGNTLVIHSNASKAGRFVATEDTSFAVEEFCLPKFNMLSSGSYKTVVAISLRESHVECSIGVSLSFSNQLAGLSLENVDVMIVMSVDHGNELAIFGESDGIDASRALRKLVSSLLLASYGVPHESGG